MHCLNIPVHMKNSKSYSTQKSLLYYYSLSLSAITNLLLCIKYVQNMRPQSSPNSCAFIKDIKEARNRDRGKYKALFVYTEDKARCVAWKSIVLLGSSFISNSMHPNWAHSESWFPKHELNTDLELISTVSGELFLYKLKIG